MLGGSDAGAHLDRMCGAPYTTRFLADCLRGRQLVSLERAVQLITDAPAPLFGLRDRGVLARGRDRRPRAVRPRRRSTPSDATLVARPARRHGPAHRRLAGRRARARQRRRDRRGRRGHRRDARARCCAPAATPTPSPIPADLSQRDPDGVAKIRTRDDQLFDTVRHSGLEVRVSVGEVVAATSTTSARLVDRATVVRERSRDLAIWIARRYPSIGGVVSS